jgi:hypothetical protein
MGKEQKPIPINIGTSKHTAPGWRRCGQPVYTCVEPAAGPHVDPAVLRAIREFDPEAVPIWQLQAFLPPGKSGLDGVVRVAHVGIARHVQDPRGSASLFRVETLPGQTAPNILDFIWMDNAQTMKDGRPAKVLPFDWSLYQYCLSKFNANTNPLELTKKWLDWQDAEAEKEEQQLRDELDYRQKHADKNIARILNGVSYKELSDQYMEIRARSRMKERKAMVFQGGR